MGWPFTTPAAPSLDSGLVATVPTSLTAVPNVVSTSTPVWLLGGHFANTTTEDIKVRITDGSDVDVVPEFSVPAKGVADFEWAFLPLTGLKWKADVAGVNGKIWGYQ